MNDPWWLAGGVDPANCVAAYQPIGADSLQASYLNLANPGTYNAAPGVAPILDPSGWSFNGSTQYLNTSIPGVTTTNSVVGRFSNAGNNTLVSSNGASFRVYLNFNYVSLYMANGGGQRLVMSSKISQGVLAMAGTRAYLNGLDIGSVNTGSLTQPIYIGADSPTPTSYFSGKVQAISLYNTILTNAQVAAITHAMDALTEVSLPTHHMPSSGMRRWAKLYSQQEAGTAFVPAWARNSNRIIIPGIQLP